MSVTVKVPPLLRRVTGRLDRIEIEAPDVAGCLAELTERYPDTKSHLFDDSGELKSSVVINVNGKDIQSVSGLQTSLKTGDVVNILLAHPAMG